MIGYDDLIRQLEDDKEKEYKDMKYEIKVLRMALQSHGEIVEENAALRRQVKELECQLRIYTSGR